MTQVCNHATAVRTLACILAMEAGIACMPETACIAIYSSELHTALLPVQYTVCFVLELIEALGMV
jgi:hypothetical protein